MMLAGCAGRQTAASSQKLTTGTPVGLLEGKVVLVNQADRFVVLSFPIGHMPTPGQRLDLYRNGSKTGEVKITGPQWDDNAVADISTGEAQPGDSVRQR